MIKRIYIFIVVLVSVAFCSHASIIAFDDSSDSLYDSGFAYQNGGTGFSSWSWGGDWWVGLVPPYEPVAGRKIDSDTRGDRGFRIFAHEGYYVHTGRSFSSSLNPGEMFSMNLGHVGGNDGEVEIRLAAAHSPTHRSTIFELSLNVTNSTWQAWDGEYFDLDDENGYADYSTTDNKDAEFTFIYHGGTSYGFTLTDGAGNGYYMASKENTAAPDIMDSIDRFGFETNDQGVNNEFYVDNLQISVVPEPMSVGLVGVVCVVGTFIRRKFAI